MLSLALKAIIYKNFKKNFFINQVHEKQLFPILREIKTSLLNSDVHINVVENFLSKIKENILNKNNYFKNQADLESYIFKKIKEKLFEILNFKTHEILINEKKINKYLFIGLNGSGKTTSVAKISNFLKNNKNLKLKNITLDIYRPGAFEQLNELSQKINVKCSKNENNNNNLDFLEEQIKISEKENLNAIVVDTFGIILDNKDLILELKEIQKKLQPTETFFVIDAMAGQDIISKLEHLTNHLEVNSLLISKCDSQSPMGAAFSASYILKIPIKFFGDGESCDKLLQFFPERIVENILGEGDILTFAEKIEEKIDKEIAKNTFERMLKGKFNLNDLILQIKEINKIGSLSSLMNYLPKSFNVNISLENNDNLFKKWEILINSMTKKERRNPKLLKKELNRKTRIIKGSGLKMDDLNKLIKKWELGKSKINEFKSKSANFPMNQLFNSIK